MQWSNEDEIIQNELKNKEKIGRYESAIDYIKANTKRGSSDALNSIDALRDIRIFLKEKKEKETKEKEGIEKATKK